MTARDLHARGEESFRRGDYLGAVEALEQVLLLMPDKEADLRVQLAHAHRTAYAIDHDPEHLHKAHAFFTDQLSSLGPDDPTREDLEALLKEIEAEFTVFEEAEARARLEREKAIRENQILRSQQERAEAESKRKRRIRELYPYYGVGGSLVVVGVGSLTVMTVFLARGAKTDRMGRETAGMLHVSKARYQDLLREGEIHNRRAMIAGITGGAVVLSGASLLVVAAIRHKRVLALLEKDEVVVGPTIGGVRLLF